MKNVLTLRSTIRPQLMRKTLFRGGILALIGIFILMYAGIFLSISTLRLWGFPIFLCSLTLITIGLLPYRELSKLEVQPFILKAYDLEYLEYIEKGKSILTIPFVSIEDIIYVDNSEDYGIGIRLKKPSPSKIKIHDPRFNVHDFQKNEHNLRIDLYFPYFSKRSFNELLLWQQDTQTTSLD